MQLMIFFSLTEFKTRKTFIKKDEQVNFKFLTKTYDTKEHYNQAHLQIWQKQDGHQYLLYKYVNVQIFFRLSNNPT